MDCKGSKTSPGECKPNTVRGGPLEDAGRGGCQNANTEDQLYPLLSNLRDTFGHEDEDNTNGRNPRGVGDTTVSLGALSTSSASGCYPLQPTSARYGAGVVTISTGQAEEAEEFGEDDDDDEAT